ncbi:MAG: outer-membrane lipoprotein carrier protein LolA [Acidobacteriota bacterium]|nr:outer-membrane lipoprotein carrier protein LolA [Acidobacteriota bacterium]
MKTFLRLGLTAIMLMLVLNAFSAVEIRAQNILPEILKRMETHRNSLTSLRSSITMVKYDSVLKVSDTTEGTIIYLPAKGRDALLRIDWTKPSQETLAVVNKKYVIYTPRRNQAITGNTSEAKGSGKANSLFVFINMSKDELKANFNIKYLGEEKIKGDIATWHLEMTPKNPASYKFNSAEMWVDGNGMPLQIKVTESNNDTTTLLLSSLQKNASINVSVFKVELPKGTKIING